MAVRPIDAEKYMELLKEQYLHNKSMGNSQAARAWQGAMQLLYDMPTLTPPNEPEYREYTCPNCHHTWLEDRDATDYPEYCPGCGEPLNRRAAEGEEDK